MQLKVTANYPQDEVRQIVMFAAKFCEINHAGLAVKVKNSSGGWHGMAYNGVCTYKDYNKGAKWLVNLYLSHPSWFPYEGIKHHFETWQECLVFLAGHEFGHIYTYQNKLKRGERFPEWIGQKCLEAWRKSDLES